MSSTGLLSYHKINKIQFMTGLDSRPSCCPVYRDSLMMKEKMVFFYNLAAILKERQVPEHITYFPLLLEKTLRIPHRIKNSTS